MCASCFSRNSLNSVPFLSSLYERCRFIWARSRYFPRLPNGGTCAQLRCGHMG
jgi:hypothetical protein